jgi:DNA repair protein SbcC/Rad50
LQSIEIEGFRGANRRQTLGFVQKATVLSARNGRGKSTFLGAVEWAIYGDLQFQPTENRAHDEVVSMFHPGRRARVRLVLAVDGRSISIERSKAVGKAASDVEFTDGNDNPIEGDEGEAAIFRLTGLSFDDFHRAAYLHQDAIRGLLVEDPKDRDAAMDRLLGIDTIRNLLTAIQLRPVKVALEEIEAKEARASEQLAGAGLMADTARQRLLREATDAGFDESGLKLEPGIHRAQALQEGLVRAGTTYGLEIPGPAQVAGIEDLDHVARRVKSAVREARILAGRGTPLDTAVERSTELKRAQAEAYEADRVLKEAQDELAAHIKDVGTDDELAAKKAVLAKTILEVQSSLRQLDAHSRVVEDAIVFLEASPKSVTCPVCGDPHSAVELVGRLRSMGGKDQAAEVRKLNTRHDQAQEALEAAAEAQKLRTRLLLAAQLATTGAKAAWANGWGVLGIEPINKTPVGKLAEQIATLENQLGGLRELNAQREKDLSDLDEGAEALRVVYRFLKAESDARTVQNKAAGGDEEGAKALGAEKARLSELRADLESIVGVLNGLASGRAQDALDRCGPEISKMYDQLCQHPYFDGLKIEVGQKPVAGVERNTYRIVAFSSSDGGRTSASSRLSTAQMNCVGLSIYLSLAKVLGHNLGFVMLDDPSQNLDGEHKHELATALGQLASGRQLVVATHDGEFDGFLRKSLGKEGVKWYDLSWSPKEGTSLQAARE